MTPRPGLRIRLADWRDRQAIAPLRRDAGPAMDGGLYEWLNWPTYHVHLAYDAGGTTLGYTAVRLLPDGVADDVGTYVVPEVRRQGIATALRLVQLRDLAVLGYSRLYCAASTDEGRAWCELGFGLPVGQIEAEPPQWYYGGRLDRVYDALDGTGAPRPHPLSVVNEGALRAKVERVQAEHHRLLAAAKVNLRKAALRREQNG